MFNITQILLKRQGTLWQHSQRQDPLITGRYRSFITLFGTGENSQLRHTLRLPHLRTTTARNPDLKECGRF